MKRFDYISYFSGLGGFDTGLNQLGGHCVLAAEWHEKTRKCYEIVHGITPKGDVRDLTWSDIPPSSLWTFGFPCQDLSIANMNGKERKKLEGEKSGLFFEIMRIAKEVRENSPKNLPDFLWAENVEDLGPLIPTLQDEFEKIGYSLKYELYNTKYWGLPQSRPRYHIIGIKHDLDIESDFFLPTEDRDLTKVPKLEDFLDEEVDEKFYYDLDAYVYETLPEKPFKQGELNQVGVLHGKGWLEYMKRVYDVKGIAPTLHTCQGGHRQAKILDKNKRVRRMVAREYLRCQGFPEEFYEKLKLNKISNSQMYLMAGNAVSVNLIIAIGRSLLPFIIKD